MFGVKTKILKSFLYFSSRFFNGKLSNDLSIQYLLKSFRVDEIGHKANIDKSDLGYGWIHYALIRYLKPKNVLCIGSRYGYIPAILAQGCKDNKKGFVDFVDPGYGQENKNHWTGVGLWKTKQGKNIFKKYGLDRQIKLHVQTSEEYSLKNNKYYDYIYVDGNHSYKGVLQDYKLFWPKLKKNGYMVFHDISVVGQKPEGIYGVKKFWDEISRKNSIDFPFDKSGLGIVQKR